MVKKRQRSNDKVDVFVGVPLSGASCNNNFRDCLDGATHHLHSTGRNVMRGWKVGASLSKNRNELVETALEMKASWVIMIDSDMLFPVDSLSRLLKHNKSVVSALAFRKSYPYRPVGQTEDKDGNIKDLTTSGDGSLMKVRRIGFGMVAIQTAIFKSLPKPWFSMAPTFLRHDGENFFIDGDLLAEDTNETLSEDHWFSDLCNVHNIPLRIDTGLSIAHLGLYPYDQDDYSAAKQHRDEAEEAEKRIITRTDNKKIIM